VTSLAVLVASGGRPTLARTLASIASQLQPGDELIVDLNDDAPWGQAARNRLMWQARADWLLFMDDDDVYVPDGLARVRAMVGRPGSAGRFHLFRMVYGGQYADTKPGTVLWRSRQVALGNVSTQMVVVPNVWRSVHEDATRARDRLPKWGERYEGDYDFILGCVARFGEPLWHAQVIAEVRPGG
jgi:glycosyltransferase involved in cell wall biosynthesis